MRLSGAWFKLADERGVYIGLLMVPEVVAVAFEKKHERYVQVYRHPKMPISSWAPEQMAPFISAATYFVIVENYSLEMPDALCLQMITPEEISAEPDFVFLPSAEYLRRPVVEKPAPEQKPVPSGKFLAAAREVAG
jgi:hypothetical protein